MTKREIFLQKFSELVTFAKSQNIRFIVFTFYRSPEEQYKMYKERKSQIDGYKKKSYHQKWRAIDLVILDERGNPIWSRNEQYEKLGKYWKDLGGTWGGDWTFNDIYHFQI